MRILLPILVLVLANAATRAAEIFANSADQNDVVLAIGAAVDGDRVHVPAGTNSYFSEIQIAKNIWLIGETNRTWIIDELTSSGSIFEFTLADGYDVKVLGFRFEGGAATTEFSAGTIFNRNGGPTAKMEIAACTFNGLRNSIFRGGGWASTWIHHNTIVNVSQTLWFWNNEWGGDTHGDGSWSNPVDWGGTNAVVFEFNTWSNAVITSICDSYAGARIVIRFNDFFNCNLASHGTGDGSGRRRGPPQWEVYVNSFGANPPTSKNAIHIRGGRVICFSNSYSGFSKYLTLHDYRKFSDHGKFGIPDGRHLWDHMGKDDGPETPGGAGDGIYAAGIAGAGSTNNILVVPGAGWTPDQWKGYIVRVTNSAAYTRTNNGVRIPPAADPRWQNYFCSLIAGNTSDTITVEKGTQEPRDKPFREGEVWEIVKALMVLDGIGAGQSDMLIDKSEFPALQDLHQKRAPCYIFANRNVDDGSMALTAANPGVWENYLWFEEKSGFNGTAGMGIGTTAQMLSITPSTTNQVGFFDIEANTLNVWSNGAWTLEIDYSVALGGSGGEPPPPPEPPAPSPARRAFGGRVNTGQLLVR